LNAVATRRDLARVSKTPGRTRRIHFFAAPAHGVALVDLPGYGFARASRQDRERFAAAVELYLRERAELRGLVMLLDVRRDPGDDERLLAEFAAARGLRLVHVATKVDKLGRAERSRRLRALGGSGIGPWIAFSSISGEGREAVIEAITALAGDQMENGGQV
jgi:GTP-binding protein